MTNTIIALLSRLHRPILAFGLCAVILSAIHLLVYGLHESYTLDSVVGSQRQEYDDLQSFIRVFSSSELAVVAVKSDRVTDPNTQSCLDMLATESQALPAVRRATAIHQVLERVPQLLEGVVLDHPLFRGTLISEDKTTAAVIIELHPESSAGDHRRATVEALRSIVEQAKHQFPHAQIVLSGPYVTMFEMFEYVREDLAVFSCFVAGLMLITLALVIGQWSSSTFAVAVAVCANLVVLGLTILLAINMSLTTQMLVILLTVLSVSNCVHIIAAHNETLQGATDTMLDNAAAMTLSRMIKPGVAVTLTSMAGFATVTITDVQPIRSFGFLMTVGLGLSLIFSWSAAFLLPKRALSFRDPRANMHDWMRKWLASLLRIALSRRRLVITFFGSVSVLCLLAIGNLYFESDFVKNFKADSSVRRGYEFVERHLSPLNSIELVIRRHDNGSVVTVPVIQALDHIGSQAVERYEVIQRAMSLVDILTLIVPRVPTSEFDLQARFAATGALLGQLVGEEALASFVSPDEQAIRLSLRTREGIHVHEKIRMAEQVRDDTAALLGDDYDVVVTGLYYFYATLIDGLINDQNRTLGLTLAAVLLCTMLFYRSYKVALLAMIPNLFPVLTCLGIMGWLGIPVNMVTSMMLAIALGIAVDDTVHYVLRFQREFTRLGDVEHALLLTQRSVGQACVFTTIVIAGGFWILCFSKFLPMVYFGAVIGMTMLMALLADLLLLPLLLAALHDKPSDR